MAQAINIRMVYINKGEHDNPHELPKENLEGSLNTDDAVYTHTESVNTLLEDRKVRIPTSALSRL